MTRTPPRSDSPTSQRIVLAFLDFLNSVELAPGVDSEALGVARDCLESVFDVNSSSTNEGIPPGLLLELFSSLEDSQHSNLGFNQDSHPMQHGTPSGTSTYQTRENLRSEGPAEDSIDLEDSSRDEIFGRFYAALDKTNFFNTSPAGIEDPSQVAKATQLFNDALLEMQKSQKKTISLGDLADFFKSKGNELMRSKEYSKAIELYTCAIALQGRNAVYYCNRAAAYTLLQRYNEAVDDCLKSIEIDPSYSKAYSRLGSAYFAQGNYHDALCKGYLKASELDPSNQAIRENIQVTKMKLMEQNTRSQHQGQESGAQSSGPTNTGAPFNSFPTGFSPTPEFIANIVRGVTSGLGQQSSVHIDLDNIFAGMTPSSGQESSHTASPNDHSPPFASFSSNASGGPNFANMFGNVAPGTGGRQAHDRYSSGNEGVHGQPDAHDAHVDADVRINFGESPEQVTDTLRSMMQMFSSQQGPPGGTARDSDHT